MVTFAAEMIVNKINIIYFNILQKKDFYHKF